MKFSVLDDDGLISIVNANTYRGFVRRDWQLEQLLHHFVNQINSHNIIVWATSKDGGNGWLVEVLDQPSERKAFRQFNFPINVTKGCLYLCPYSDLTMVAQFQDEVIPLKHNSHLKIDIDDGIYDTIIRQMFDVQGSNHWDSDITHFEIIFSRTAEPIDQKTDKVFWWVQ